MRRGLTITAALLALALPQAAWCCGGQAGSAVAITYDGGKYTVSNVGRQWLDIVFTSWNTSYNLRLAPGQSASPYSPGMLGQFMQGYQSCVATVVPTR
ncbi:MAG TPA: hypothetical protein VGL35_12645 [Rhizomicrobium sp.]|jgi:hypothetical protein